METRHVDWMLGSILSYRVSIRRIRFSIVQTKAITSWSHICSSVPTAEVPTRLPAHSSPLTFLHTPYRPHCDILTLRPASGQVAAPPRCPPSTYADPVSTDQTHCCPNHWKQLVFCSMWEVVSAYLQWQFNHQQLNRSEHDSNTVNTACWLLLGPTHTPFKCGLWSLWRKTRNATFITCRGHCMRAHASSGCFPNSALSTCFIVVLFPPLLSSFEFLQAAEVCAGAAGLRGASAIVYGSAELWTTEGWEHR